VAAALVAFSFNGGGSSVTSRSIVGILVSWAVGVGLLFSVLPRERPPRAAMIVGGVLAAYAALVLLSMIWAPSAEGAYREFVRTALYLGLFAFTVLASRRADVRRWADGLAIGIAAIAMLALSSRFVPGLATAGELPPGLASASTRLNWPVGYWNGLAILLGLGIPLLLRAAAASAGPFQRGLAVLPLPALAAAIYLTSSRGGAVVAAIGATVFILLCARRFAAIQALLVGGIGAVGAIAAVQASPELVNGPLDRAVIEAHGPGSAFLVALCCLAAGGIYAAIAATMPTSLKVPRPLIGAAAIGVVVVVAFAIGDPTERIDRFRAVPEGSAVSDPDFVRSHLLSTGGSGRWQFWSAALSEFREHPVLGGGAGSYETWWAQHGSLPYFVRNAHSLWFETLAETGLLGLLLLGGAVLGGLALGLRALLRGRPEEERAIIASLVAVVVAFSAGTGIDWIWQLPVVGAVGVIALALLVRVASPARPDSRESVPARRSLDGYAVGVAVVVCAWLLACAHAIPLLVDNELQASRAAAAAGDLDGALDHAQSARAIQPWAASPHLQRALVLEELGYLSDARLAIGEAIRRSDEDWRLWVVRARLATKAGEVAQARTALGEARRLNPRSPLLRPSPAGSEP
jgi:hypothetical protein